MSNIRNRKAQQQKKSDPLEAQKDTLIKDLNFKKSRALVHLATHFGKRKNVLNAHVTDLDSDGFDLVWEYEDEKSDTGDVSKEDMRFAFYKQAYSVNSFLKSFSELVEESEKELGILPENATTEKDLLKPLFAFDYPNLKNAIITSLLMSLNVYLVFGPNSSTFAKTVLKFIPLSFLQSSFKFLVVVHVLEAFFAALVCKLLHGFIPDQITLGDGIKWTVGTLLLGVNCLVPLLKKVQRELIRKAQ